jgi:hypothetical protein
VGDGGVRARAPNGGRDSGQRDSADGFAILVNIHQDLVGQQHLLIDLVDESDIARKLGKVDWVRDFAASY